MKKVLRATLCVVVLNASFSCKTDNAASKINKDKIVQAEKRDATLLDGPKISFDREVHDFGTVKEGEYVETSFKLTNTGKSPLVITDAKATCGCTVPTWPKDPVAPGDSAEIHVKFNTRGKPNKQSKTVTLSTNTEKGNETVKITGMVIPKSKK